MREYTIKLDEDDVKYLELIREDYAGKAGHEGYLETLDRILYRILYAKQKSYTNFDKIKNEMTIKDLCNEQVCEMIVKTSKVGKEWCKNKFKQFEGECLERECEGCCKKWLESEVKE